MDLSFLDVKTDIIKSENARILLTYVAYSKNSIIVHSRFIITSIPYYLYEIFHIERIIEINKFLNGEIVMSRALIDFYSTKLYMNTNVYVILPNTNVDFLANGVRYNEDGELKVVWLLHGMGDDYTGWLRFTNLERYALARGIAVVCPSVHSQSFYSNMVKGMAYYDYIADELPAFMKETFPQFSLKREDNYIAGLSMGAYGALKFGLSRPEQYCKVGSLSGGNFVEMELPPQSEAEDFMTPFYGVARNAFGTETLRDAVGTEHDLKHLLDIAVEQKKQIPDISMYCGTEDFIKSISDSMADYILKKAAEYPIRFSYKTYPGMHDWNFWDARIPEMLDDMGLTSLLP